MLRRRLMVIAVIFGVIARIAMFAVLARGVPSVRIRVAMMRIMRVVMAVVGMR